MVAAIRSYPVRCVFCQGRGTFDVEDWQDHERQEVARVLIQIAAKHSSQDYPVTPESIIGPRRTISVVDARHEAMFYLREVMGLTFQRVGYYLKRDHSSCVHGVNKHKERVEADA